MRLASGGLSGPGTERLRTELVAPGAPVESADAADTAKVHVFLPEKPTGRAVLICPGGGYGSLAMAKEGTDWAGFLNNMGIAAVVLKYRMPHGVKEVAIGDARKP